MCGKYWLSERFSDEEVSMVLINGEGRQSCRDKLRSRRAAGKVEKLKALNFFSKQESSLPINFLLAFIK